MLKKVYDFDDEGDLIDLDEIELPDDEVISSWEDIEEPMKRKIINGEVYVENFTGGPADVMEAGKGWIRTSTLAERFRELCEATGMTCGALATYCGVSAHTMSNYRSGETCCPRSVWQLVKSRRL